MKLGANGNIEKIFEMPRQQLIEFVMKADYIYRIQKETSKIGVLIRNLQGDNPEQKEQICLSTTYQQIINSEGFKKFLNKNRLANSDESICEYCNNIMEASDRSVCELKSDFDDILFQRYFRKEFEKNISKNKQVSKDFLRKYSELKRLFKSEGNLGEKARNRLLDFIEKFDEIEKIYCNQIINKAIENEHMTLKDFIKYLDALSYEKDDINKITDIKYELIKIAVAKNSNGIKQELVDLIEYLYTNNKLGELQDYSVKKIQASNGNIGCIYMKNGEVILDNFGYCKKEVTDKNQKNYNELFDFTLGKNEDMKKIISQFENIREAALQSDSNAKICILNRTIAITSNNKTKFFMIDNEIMCTDIISDLSIDLEEEKQKGLIPIRNNLVNFVKRVFYKITNIKKKKDENKEIQVYENMISSKEKRQKWLENSISIENMPITQIHQVEEKKKYKEFNQKDEEKY